MDYGFALACLALVLALAACVRCYVPPQQRGVNDLRARIEDLEHDTDDLHKRLNKRAGKENMEKARFTHEERAARREAIEAEAAAVIAASKATPITPPPDDHAYWMARAGLTPRKPS